MAQFFVCFESPAASDIELSDLYWRVDQDGRWLYTVKQIASYLNVMPSAVSARIASVAPAYIYSSRCVKCGLPHKAANRTEFESALKKREGDFCSSCVTEAIRKSQLQRLEADQKARSLQEAIWKHNVAATPDIELDVDVLDIRDVFEAYAVYLAAAIDDDGNLSFEETPPFHPEGDGLSKALLKLHNENILQFGSKTPLNAFVPGESVSKFEYYPAKIVWKFSQLYSTKFSFGDVGIGRILAQRLDAFESNSERWEMVAYFWWTVGKAELYRYLREQLDRYGLTLAGGDALDEAISYALENFSIPQARNLLWKVAKDIAAYSAERGIVKTRAINAIPGKLTRTIDRYVANGWDVKPYVLRWDDEECLQVTLLFDRVLRTGVEGFKTLTGKKLSQQRALAINQPVGKHIDTNETDNTSTDAP